MPRKSALKIGVSSCLLGQEVRYDGGHAYEPFIAETLNNTFELVSICPEAELGMGTPRETVRLVGPIDAPRMVGSHSVKDWTAGMKRWSSQRARQEDAAQFCGYVFKRNSPSCGVFAVKVYPDKGRPRRKGRGLFAAEFTRRFPLVPIEEEVRLHDPQVREHFIVRVFALARLRQVFSGRWRRPDINEFHNSETALLQAHNPHGLKQLQTTLDKGNAMSPVAFRDQYQAAFMATLSRPATITKHARVLRRLAKLVNARLSAPEQKFLAARIDDFQHGRTPLLVPQILLQNHGQQHAIEALQSSSYLNPDFRELMLRNHA